MCALVGGEDEVLSVSHASFVDVDATPLETLSCMAACFEWADSYDSKVSRAFAVLSMASRWPLSYPTNPDEVGKWTVAKVAPIPMHW